MPSINMFNRSFASRDRAGKATKISKKSFRDNAKRALLETVDSPPVGKYVFPGSSDHGGSSSRGRRRSRAADHTQAPANPTDSVSPNLTSAIVTLVVGSEQRLFAAHEDVLCNSPFFAAVCRDQFFEANARRISLPDEEPEVLSCVLEYLYKGDYYPRLVHDKRRNTWMLEGAVDESDYTSFKNGGGRGAGGAGADATIHHSGVGETILRDTAVYCAADRYGLDELKRVALRKQGLQSGIEVGTILRSARYAYARTPDSDSRLRAHYLALIIRCRRTFKRSGTMQMEMEMGGRLFFDLFVAMCNHIDDIVDMGNSRSPKTI